LTGLTALVGLYLKSWISRPVNEKSKNGFVF
jgi:hypothetical protein